MSRFSRCLVFMVISHALFLTCAHAQTATVIPANQAAAHVGERSGVYRMDGVNSCVRQLFGYARRQGPERSPRKRPSVPTVLGESEKPLLVLRRRGAVI